MESRKSPAHELAVVTDPVQSAKTVGLRYFRDDRPGIRRIKAGTGFRYLDSESKPVRDPDTLRRIKSLAVPPAWTRVWICPRDHGHLQATGLDARGRKQYRYHPRWRQVRDQTKYNRLIEFGEVLPKIRERVRKDLLLPGLPRAKVLATVVRLLEVTLIRVGNEEYARENHSFGLTTMRDKHVQVSGDRVRFHFRGKSGKEHQVEVDDPRVARIIRRCQDLPGQELFQYVDDDGQRQQISSTEVNEYLKEITGEDFTAKDFRTWAGTVLAARALQELAGKDGQPRAKRNIVRAVEAVSQVLGNTPTICRKCYVHPAVLDAYLDGALVDTLRRRADEEVRSRGPRLRRDEAPVLDLLRTRVLQSAPTPTAARNGSLSSQLNASRLSRGLSRARRHTQSGSRRKLVSASPSGLRRFAES